MNEIRQNFMVGLFVLCALIGFGVLAVLFGRDSTLLAQSDAYMLHIDFERAPGMKTGTIVSIGGKEVGRVTAINFRDINNFAAGIRVTAAFDRGIVLREGTKATTMEPGVGMGRPPIELIPGPPEAPILASGSALDGDIRRAFEGLVPPNLVATFEATAGQIAGAAEKLQPVLEDLHVMLRPLAPAEVDSPEKPLQGNLSSAAARLDGILRETEKVLADPNVQNQLRATIDNAHQVSESAKRTAADLEKFSADAKAVAEQAKTLATKAQGTLDNVDTQINAVARDVRGGLEQASSFLTEMNRIAARVSAGEGTVGKLLTDDRFYESLVLTVRRLGEALEEFKALVKEWQKGRIKVAL